MSVLEQPVPRALDRKIEHRRGNRLVRLDQPPEIVCSVSLLLRRNSCLDGRSHVVEISDAVINVLDTTLRCSFKIQVPCPHGDGDEVSKSAVFLQRVSRLPM